MNVFNSPGQTDYRNQMNVINPFNKNPPMQISQPGNVAQSGNFENEGYQFFSNNPYSQQLASINEKPSKYSCFLAYLYNEKSVAVGPILLNVCCPTNTNLGEPFSMEFNFINQGLYFNENLSKITRLKEIQTKFESTLSSKNIFSKHKFENAYEFMKQMYENDSMKFQLLQLPFDNFKVSSGSKSNIPKVESSTHAQIANGGKDITRDEYLDFLRQEIQLLKDQNQLLRLQLEIRSEQTNGQPIKEYILRRPPYATNKSSRNPSSASTAINLYESESPAKMDTTSNSMVDNELKEGSPLYEILQEYMLENENLRNQNNALNELRARYNSEMQLIYKQNQELFEKVKELRREINHHSTKNLENHPQNMMLIQKPFKKENQSENPTQDYQIMYDKSQNSQDKNSYLHQYDTVKPRNNVETLKKGLPGLPKSVKNNSFPEKPTHNTSKNDKDTNAFNESLKEELGRIDNTIKEHIRQVQFNNTLRTMGVNVIPSKK